MRGGFNQQLWYPLVSQLLGPSERHVYIKKRASCLLLREYREINQAESIAFHECSDFDQIRLPLLPFQDRDFHENDVSLFQYFHGATQHFEFEALRIDLHEKWALQFAISIQWNDVYLARLF